MIEIRTYDGDGEDVADLTARAWRAAYGGKSWCPFWSAEYLGWQLLRSPNDRDFLVAAYDGCRLVGCFFAERTIFRTDDHEVVGTIGSWFTVDPEARSPRLGIDILEELRRRHREHGAAFLLGYVNGDPRTPANKFWSGYARLYPEQIRFVRRMGYWIRVLNAASLRRKCIHRFERLGVDLHGLLPFQRAPRGTGLKVRDYSDGDLNRCARLVTEVSEDADLAVVWAREQLASQLDWNGYPRTLVLDRGDAPFGMVNYHRFGLLGTDIVTTGLIDLLGCEGGSTRDRRSLLRSAVARMASEGLDIALTLRTSMFPPRVMVPCGFWPLPQSEHLTYVFPQPDRKLPLADRPFILLR